MQNHHGGMILKDGFVYCGDGHNEGFPLCIDSKTGKDAWRPGRGPGSGSAAVAYADGHLYFRYQDGTMALIEATPKAYKLKGKFKIASHNGESWPHPVIAGGKLYLRDQDELLVLRHQEVGPASRTRLPGGTSFPQDLFRKRKSPQLRFESQGTGSNSCHTRSGFWLPERF